MANSFSSRAKQIEALKRVLMLNEPSGKASFVEPSWKVLIYDNYGQDVISPLLTVKDLRDLGVTLFLHLHSERDPLPDVPAVYLVYPTEKNIQRIVQDLRMGVYGEYYFNFLSAISRQMLEDLAAASIQHNCISQVKQVYDQYVNFISLEEDLFTTRHQDRDAISFYALNRPDAKDADIEYICNILVDCLFSVLVTLGAVPIIRCSPGNAAEMVAEALDKKIKENLRDTRNCLFTSEAQLGSMGSHRPLLVVLDRSVDLCTPLHHAWTYQALVHDIMDLQLNKLTLVEEIPMSDPSFPPKKRKTCYDFQPSDKFWQQQKGSPFPSVADAIQKELQDYRASQDQVKQLGIENGTDDNPDAWSSSTNKISSAVSSLPELLEKKRLIDMHMNIATAVLDVIKKRKLDLFFEAEEKILSKVTLDKPLIEFMSEADTGVAEDKLRLLVIYLLAGNNFSQSDYDSCVQSLVAAGVDTSALNYIKKWKSFSKTTTSSGLSGMGLTLSASSAKLSKIVSSTSQFMLEGIRGFTMGSKSLPVTRIVENLLELKSSQETDDYRYFDPRMFKNSTESPQQQLKNRSPFTEAIVFVIGGGSYMEYLNLVSVTKKPGSQKRIIYGCSELCNGNQFLKQLSQLGM